VLILVDDFDDDFTETLDLSDAENVRRPFAPSSSSTKRKYLLSVFYLSTWASYICVYVTGDKVSVKAHKTSANTTSKTTEKKLVADGSDYSPSEPSESDGDEDEDDDEGGIPFRHLKHNLPLTKQEKDAAKYKRVNSTVASKLASKVQKRAASAVKTRKKRDKLLTHSHGNIDTTKRKVMAQNCRVKIESRSGLKMDHFELPITNLKLLGEDGGQRLVDEALVDTIANLIMYNSYVDVSPVGVWFTDMYMLSKGIEADQILKEDSDVYGGQHYYSAVLQVPEFKSFYTRFLPPQTFCPGDYPRALYRRQNTPFHFHVEHNYVDDDDMPPLILPCTTTRTYQRSYHMLHRRRPYFHNEYEDDAMPALVEQSDASTYRIQSML
jgi:hypothetical protein